jgi:hypothetical protein
MQKSALTSISPDRLRAVRDVLGADTQRCLDVVTHAATAEERLDQFWARALVRSFFAYAEGLIYEMAVIVQAAHDVGLAPLSSAEAGALPESTWELDGNGTPRSRNRFVPFERRARFVFGLFGRVYGVSSALPVGEHGWQCLVEAVQIRHRLTHPKDPSALDLTVADLNVLIKAVTWYFGVLTDQLKLVLASLDSPEFIERLRRASGA